MQIADFSDFLAAAHAQEEPQQLLFVFAVAELPPTHSPGQKKRYEAGRGGALAPVMCVAKEASELPDFPALARESRQTGQPWDLVFVAALPGANGLMPASADTDRALRGMISAVHRGGIERFLAFDPEGAIVAFQ